MRSLSKVSCIIGAAVPVLAWSAPPDMALIEKTTATLAECSKLADQIIAVPVPIGHARHKQDEKQSTSQQAASDPQHKVVLDKDQQAFTSQMKAADAQLAECGKVFQVEVKNAEALMKTIIADARQTRPSEQDAAQISKVVMAYQKSKQALITSVANLSQDKQHEIYVHGTLVTYFLVPH